MGEGKMFGMNQSVMGVFGLVLFVFAMAIVCYLIVDYGKEIGEKKVGKPTDNQHESITPRKENLTEITMALVILGLIAYIASRHQKGRKK
jgi:Ca2+/Na+ antiporter